MHIHNYEEMKTRSTDRNVCCKKKKKIRERTTEGCVFQPFVRSDPWLWRRRQNEEETKDWEYKWNQGQIDTDRRG